MKILVEVFQAFLSVFPDKKKFREKRIKHITFQLNDTEHTIDMRKARISVDNGEYRRISKYPCAKEALERKYTIPVGEDSINVYEMNEFNFVHDGINLVTGEPYVPLKIPFWAWLFFLIYVLAFFYIAIDVIGAAVAVLGIRFTISISVNRKYPKTIIRVLACLVLLLLLELTGFGIVFVLATVAANFSPEFH